MLQSSRKLAKTKAFKLVVYILIGAFALSGVSAGFMADFSDNYIVKVDGEKIYAPQVQQRYKIVVDNLRSRGIDFSEEQLASMGISPSQVLQSIIQEKLLLKQVKDMDISVGDEYITKEISSSQLFQKDGKFDTERFNTFLYQMGVRESVYIERLRGDITTNILMAIMLNDNVVNQEIEENMIENFSESRTVRIVQIPANKQKFTGEISDKDLEDFYFENSFMFEVPEKRSATYLTITGKAGDEAATYELVAAVEDELAGGSTLKEVSEKHKVELKQAKNIEGENEELPTILTENIFALEEGEPSNVIEDGNSYYVIQINEINKSYIPELADVKSEASKALKIEKDKMASREFANKVYKEIKEKQDYRPVARGYNLKTEKLDSFKRDELASVSFDLFQDSFASGEGEVFGVYENSEGGYDIAILEKISQEELSEIDLAKYTDQAAKQLEAEILSQYMVHLEQKFPVEENPNFEVK